MDMKGSIQYLVAIALAAGLTVGAGALMLGGTGGGPPTAEASATLTMNELDDSNSTEIRGIYVVKSTNVSEAMNDNLEADPSGLVVASFTSDGGTAEVDWGTEYELIAYCYGEENEVSNDPANIRLGWDGDYWGDGDGTAQMPGENSAEESMFSGGEDGFNPADSTFSVGGDIHIALNYRGNSGGFSLSRDETANLNEILLQAYY